MAYSESGFESHIVHVLKYHCKDGPQYTETEKVMAVAEGIDLHELHVQMDTWERYCDAVLDGQPNRVDTGEYYRPE